MPLALSVVTPVTAPPPVTLSAFETNARTPVALPIVVLAVPVVFKVIVPFAAIVPPLTARLPSMVTCPPSAIVRTGVPLSWNSAMLPVLVELFTINPFCELLAVAETVNTGAEVSVLAVSKLLFPEF